MLGRWMESFELRFVADCARGGRLQGVPGVYLSSWMKVFVWEDGMSSRPPPRLTLSLCRAFAFCTCPRMHQVCGGSFGTSNFVPPDMCILEATAKFAARNGILIGGGGVKLFEDGRELVVRLKGGATSYTFTGLLRASQIKTLIKVAMQAVAEGTIATVDF
jgi:hypothetical protein